MLTLSLAAFACAGKADKPPHHPATTSAAAIDHGTVTPLEGSADNAPSPELQTFRDAQPLDDTRCFPRRPTAFGFAYERELLRGEGIEGDRGSLALNDAMYCDVQFLSFQLTQTLPDGVPLAWSEHTLLVAQPEAVVIYEHDERRGWLASTTIAERAIAAAYLAAHDEFVLLTEHKRVVILRRYQHRDLAETTRNEVRPTWRQVGVIEAPAPDGEPMPASHLLANDDQLLWWSATRRRGHVLTRMPNGDYAYRESLGPVSPLRHGAEVVPLSMSNSEIVLRVVQDPKGTDMLQRFTGYFVSDLDGSSETRATGWFYRGIITRAPRPFLAAFAGPLGSVVVEPGVMPKDYVLHVRSRRAGEDAEIIQLIDFDRVFRPVAMTDLLMVGDCSDLRTGPATCAFARNAHGVWEYSQIIEGLLPLAYVPEIGMLVGRDYAGPGATARLVLLAKSL